MPKCPRSVGAAVVLLLGAAVGWAALWVSFDAAGRVLAGLFGGLAGALLLWPALGIGMIIGFYAARVVAGRWLRSRPCGRRVPG